MPIIVKIQDIDEAIENLRYKNETTLKSKLLRAVRQYYLDDTAVESLQTIETEELVKTVWETGDDSNLLKAKRKNFSSLKSSVNSDLKKLYSDGKNPQGIVIGHNNVFSISDEAKDKALAGIMDVFKEKGIDTQSKISEILSALSDILSTAVSETEVENTKEEIDRLKDILGGISGKLGLSLQDIIRRAEDKGGGGAQMAGSDNTQMDLPGKGEDLSGYIRGGLSMIDQGLQGLAREIEEASSRPSQKSIVESVRTAIDDIIQVLKDSKTDESGKAQKIMVSATRMITDSIEAVGSGLSGDQAGRLKQIFHEMTEGMGEGNLASDKPATPAQLAGGEWLAAISAILGDGGLSAGEKIGKIMDTVNDLLNDTLVKTGVGLGDDDQARIREMMDIITGNIEALVQQSFAGAEASDVVEESMRKAFAQMIQALQDTEADVASKAGRIMAAVEGLLSEAIDASGSGLSGDQADELKQIIHGITEGAGAAEPVSGETAEQAGIAGNQLIQSVSAILGDGELSTGDKIGKIMSTLNEMIGDALDKGGAGLNDEDQARVREMLDNITGSLDALAGMEIVEEIVEEGAGESVEILEEVVSGGAEQATAEWEESGEFIDAGAAVEEAGTGAADEGIENIEDASAEAMDETFAGTETTDRVKDAMQAALAGIVEAIQDTGMDAAGKAAKIMAAVEGMLDQAIDASGGRLSGDQVDELKQIFHEMAEGAGEGNLAADQMATPAQIAGGDLLAMVSTILSDGGLSAADKVGKIMAAINDLVGNALGGAGAGLNEDEIAQIKGMMDNVAGNLDAFAQGALSIEETVEEDTGQAGEGEGPTDVAEGEVMLSEEAGTGQSLEEQVQNIEGLSDVSGDLEEIVEGVADENAAFVEEIVGDDAVIAEAGAGDESVEFVEVEDSGQGGFEEVLEEGAAPETQSVQLGAEGETGEESADQEFVEEIIEDVDEGASGITVTPANQNIDDDLREKTDLLTRLAEAAGMLQGLGPDLNGSIYTEEEIRGKAQFLSEEFDHYLSIRDKFYNAHILIKGGDYLVGGAHLAKSVLEEQIVTLPDFYIGKFPVTNALFEIFVEQTGYVTTAEKYGYSLVYFPRMQRSRDPITGVERFSLHNQAYSKKVPGACWHRPLGPDSSLYLKRTHPVVQVSMEDAQAFAAWTGKRIPTEIEWEAAARTAQGLIYPWGNDWRDNACNVEQSLHGDTTPVDRYVKFANPFEVADMLGNVLEWTSDVIGDRETSDTYIVKGASWISHHEISLTDRHYLEKSMSSNILGFRCVAI